MRDLGVQEEVFAASTTLRRPSFCTHRPRGRFSPVQVHLPSSGVGGALWRGGVPGKGHWAGIRHLERKTFNASHSDAQASAAPTPGSTRKTGSSARLRFEIAGMACQDVDQVHEPALGASSGAGGSSDTRQRVATLVGCVRSPASVWRRRGRNARPAALHLSGRNCNRREAFFAGGTTSRISSASRPWRRPPANRGECRNVAPVMDVDDVAGQHAHLCQARPCLSGSRRLTHGSRQAKARTGRR